LVKTGDVVLVVLDESSGTDSGRSARVGMDAILLMIGISYSLGEVGDAAAGDTNQESCESWSWSESQYSNGFKPRQEGLVGLVALARGNERVFGEFVVVA